MLCDGRIAKYPGQGQGAKQQVGIRPGEVRLNQARKETEKVNVISVTPGPRELKI